LQCFKPMVSTILRRETIAAASMICFTKEALQTSSCHRRMSILVPSPTRTATKMAMLCRRMFPSPILVRPAGR
jgi:hypothetical protein